MEQKILGAIIGDVVGSRFEFNNIKTKEFALLSSHSRPTDDSIMTLAVMDMCVNNRFDREGIIQTFKKWGKAYPNAGYGYNFYSWVLTDDPNPYYSCGNGSAMRISPVAYVANSVEETIKLAIYSLCSSRSKLALNKDSETSFALWKSPTLLFPNPNALLLIYF